MAHLSAARVHRSVYGGPRLSADLITRHQATAKPPAGGNKTWPTAVNRHREGMIPPCALALDPRQPHAAGPFMILFRLFVHTVADPTTRIEGPKKPASKLLLQSLKTPRVPRVMIARAATERELRRNVASWHPDPTGRAI